MPIIQLTAIINLREREREMIKQNCRDSEFINIGFRVVLGWAYRSLTGGFLLLQNFSVSISVSPRVCFILVLILNSMFLR